MIKMIIIYTGLESSLTKAQRRPVFWACKQRKHRIRELLISLTWKYIISCMSRREAFSTPLLVVVGKSPYGQCEWQFLCPGSGIKILISQLHEKTSLAAYLLNWSLCSFKVILFLSIWFPWLVTTSFTTLQQKVWVPAIAGVPVVQLGLWRWARCGHCPQRTSSLGKKRHMSQELWSRWAEESPWGTEQGLWKLRTGEFLLAKP